MTVQLLFFGISTDLVGANTMTKVLNDNTTVKDLREVLAIDYAGLNRIHEFAIAVNENYAEDELVLTNGDIVAIIPPVSGG